MQIIILFFVSFSLTLLSSWVGDDDVAYKFLDRKPTGQEAIARIRFVIAKFFASMSGGSVLAVLVGRSILQGTFRLTLSGDQAILLGLACMIATYLLIGVLQNIVRRLQGRQPRSITEFNIMKHNFKARI